MLLSASHNTRRGWFTLTFFVCFSFFLWTGFAVQGKEALYLGINAKIFDEKMYILPYGVGLGLGRMVGATNIHFILTLHI